jgi:hypothetical protein
LPGYDEGVNGITAEEKIKRSFQAVLLELLRYRSSLVRLHRVVRGDRQRLKQLEKKVESFVEPN